MLDVDLMFPLKNVYLLDWWVGRIIRSPLIAKRRCQNWPEDFSSKGYVLASRRNKGSPYKIQDEEGVWRYAIATGRYQLHGAEGSGLRAVREGEWSADKGLILGDEALTQNDSSVKFRGVVKEDMEEIEAGLIRTKKRKMKRSTSWISPFTVTGRI